MIGDRGRQEAILSERETNELIRQQRGVLHYQGPTFSTHPPNDHAPIFKTVFLTLYHRGRNKNKCG